MWRLLLGTMGVKSLVQGLNAAATAGFEPRTVWSEVRRRNRLATAPPSKKRNGTLHEFACINSHRRGLWPYPLDLALHFFFCLTCFSSQLLPLFVRACAALSHRPFIYAFLVFFACFQFNWWALSLMSASACRLLWQKQLLGIDFRLSDSKRIAGCGVPWQPCRQQWSPVVIHAAKWNKYGTYAFYHLAVAHPRECGAVGVLKWRLCNCRQ